MAEGCPVSAELRGDDISLDQSGSLFKKIMTPGVSDEMPTKGAEVTGMCGISFLISSLCSAKNYL